MKEYFVYADVTMAVHEWIQKGSVSEELAEQRGLVELVRCKDCKHRSNEMYDYYGNPNNKVYVCQIHDLAKKPDWFCADGERRADDA